MRARLVDCLLLIASIVLAVLTAEAVFSLLVLRYVPLRLHEDLPEDVRVFAQSSKIGVVPRDPVLLLGDSYAQGFGDWLFETDPNRNGPFHSAHVIHRLSGRDVVTLGVSGTGSAEAMAAWPAIAYSHTKSAWYLRLPLPHVAVVYFYEGNDLNNNLRYIQERIKVPDAADVVERVDYSIAAYPSELFVHTGWGRHLPLLRFSERMVRRIYAKRASTEAMQGPQSNDATSVAHAGQLNVVEVAGQAIQLPPNLQSPAMELTRQELEQAVLVYERSLAFLSKFLPGTPVLVAYIPSPLSTYRLLGQEVSIQQYVAGRANRHPKESVAEDSDRICLMIRTATIGQGAGFLDLRAPFRAASKHDILHGPRDFKHFNRIGMEVLGQAVSEQINRPLAQETCSQTQIGGDG